MADCILVGNSGAGGGSSDYIDFFSDVEITGANGITVSSSELENNIADLSFTERQAGYEGFNIVLKHLDVGTSYIVNFDFQYTDAEWFINQYMSGVILSDTVKSDYNNFTSWTENIDRDLIKHNHRITFTATATKMYLSFNVCSLSDSRTNYFEVTNLYVVTA